MKTLFVLLAVVIVAVGCTQQQRAKTFGGTASEILPPNQKLMNVTWKDDHLWFLLRPMNANDVAESYQFKESANWGLLNGTVTITETKTIK